MSKHRRNANFHLLFFVRNQFWSLLIPSIAILFLTFCPQLSQSIEVNIKDYNQKNENPDRTVAKLGPREIQLTTTLTPSLLSVPTASSTSKFDDFIHTLYVISLDGKITAIDAHANGRQLWTADTGAPLIDSSLSKIEISRDSRSVRLIPSLIGGLFEKYDEDGHVEPLPFDAGDLLDASFKLHEELVITGGKHIDTLGLDLHTGQVLYSFSKDDPKQKNTFENNRTTTTTDNTNSRATLVVKRTTQTVRARSARNGHEKWNFSVSNNELLHLHSPPAAAVLGEIDGDTTFSGYFEYQLQTGVVLAFDKTGHPTWSSPINAPIASVWELKNGQLNEKSLFETTAPNHFSTDDSNDDEEFVSVPTSRRLAFIGEFNSTPYVIVSPRVQKELIHDARKNNLPGLIGNQRPVLSSWHKVYQKRTLSIGSEIPENNHQRQIGESTSDHSFPLALRPDSTGNHHKHSTSASSFNIETCNEAGYLQLFTNRNEYLTEENDKQNVPVNVNTHLTVYIPKNTLTISSLFLGALIIFLIWYLKQNQFGYKRQESMITESTNSTILTPPSTPEYYQLEQPLTPPFQSRYTLEYEHVRFLGRGGFGVVFEAINKLDQRRVAIKRVSLKKASGKERALKEIRYLAILNHPNLIQYYYAWNESPPIGWQEEQDKTLLIKNNINTRDSMSTFPTSAASGNDSESILQTKNSKLSSIPPISVIKPTTTSPPSLFDITFDRSSNPLRIDEDFSANSINNNDNKSDISSSSSSSSVDNQTKDQLDANNNNKSTKYLRTPSTTKRSLSSSSPLFDHSSDSSIFSNEFYEKTPSHKEVTESDDGIIFLHDEQQSSSSPSPVPIETKSLIEKKKSLTSDKDFAPTYFYFVMELCQPESLRDRLIQRTIDRQQAWSIFDQITRGIEYIHSQKLIHRDLKPSNILFSMDNTVKIGDFGLVSAFGEDKIAKKKKRDDENIDQMQLNETISTTTDGCENNEVGGTMLYMSPEQINREPYNQKVDIYAMGIILFELLYPFSTQMERMRAIANVRLQTPVFPNDFERDGNNRNQLICRLIRWLLSYSSHDRPRASELLRGTFYQRILQVEAPNLLYSDNRQQNQTIVNGQDQTLVCSQQAQFGRHTSSSFRRTVSSSALESLRESDSGDAESLS
ncbi:unnamed protein product [Rotaria sp. Silwood1]|nr:unnamed protein product [Rotaria sp. Silwood1]CAF1108820.1 unnamed protein product [Rotaria sp. Silwood1]